MADRCACRRKLILAAGVRSVTCSDGTAHGADACTRDFAPELIRVLRELVEQLRDDGVFVADMDTGAPEHDPGSDCVPCRALVLLVRAEGGGRCAVCGCTQGSACEGGCGWTNAQQICCDNHPLETILAAEMLFDGEKKKRRA